MGTSETERGGLLLVEDDQGVCELEAQRLEPLGLPIRRAHSAGEGAAALAAGPRPDLMLVDYSLPEQNALQFIDGLRSSGAEVPPFLVVTGRGDEAVAVASMKAGACDYLVKNSEFLDNLLPSVRKALERVELQRQLEAARESTAKNLHLYTFLAQVNVAAARSRERGGLYRKICDIAVSAGLKMAWIGDLDRDLGRITPVCWSGAVEGYLDGIRIYVGADSPESKGPTGIAASTRKISHCADIARDPAMAPWREKALARGYRSSAAIPLEEGGTLAAVLNLYSDQTGFFAGDELQLLEEIKADIALALEAISAEEKRAAAQSALERTASDLAHIMDVTPVMLLKLRLPASGIPVLEWVSGNTETLTGYTPEEALRPDWVKENMHPDDRSSGSIGDIFAKKAMVKDFRFRRKDGSYFWVHAQLKLSREETGEITGSWTDITALKESEARFHDLFEKAPLGYQSLDEEGNFLEVNQAWLDTLGYRRGEVIGKWFGDFVAPEYRGAFRERFPQFKAAGKVHSEFEMLRKNGERRFIAFDGRIARTPSGDFQRTHCILKDISDAKLAELRLKSSEARFRTLFECGNDAMFMYQFSENLSEIRFVEVNRVACERLGYSREELLHMGPASIGAEGMDEARAEALRKLAREGRAVFEMTHKAKDGRLIPVEVSAGRFDYDGKPYVLSVARDVSERRRAEAEKSLLSEAIKASLNEIYLFDAQTLRFRFLNAGALRNTGYSEKEALLLTPLDLKPDITREFFDGLTGPLLRGERQVQVFETRHRRKDGSLYDVEVHLQYMPQQGAFLAVINDVTGKKRMEAELLKSQKIESLGVLAGGIAHDFNNMLTGITANLSLLAARNPGSADLLEDALSAARSAQALTTQLLSFSKGGQPVKRETRLQKSLGDIFHLSTRGSAVRTELRIAGDLWSASVDEDQVKQAINNLLLNGMQAMPGGGILRLAAENAEVPPGAAGTPPPGKYIRITVSDTGVGIPPKYLEHIYEPYFTTKSKGHGLGLPMTWNVVRSHGGHIEVTSRQGEGTEFTVYLPATGRVLPQAATGPRPVQKGSGRVLLLEDEEIVSKTARRLLADLGYSCEVTTDGKDTLRVYEAEAKAGRPFDAVLLDLTIPGGTGGKDTGAELRRRYPEAVIIVSSGYSDEPVMSDYRANGFDAVLPKPYRYEDLAETLARLLKKG